MDRILVVDDDKMNLKMAEHILKQNYEVLCVTSGEEALEILAGERMDLILLDLHMPGMDGLEVFEKIKASDRMKDTPVIFLTADSERETEVEIFKAGAMDYIQKPFLAEVVIRRIGRILELYHLQQSLQNEVDKKTVELRESNRKVRHLSEQMMMTLANTVDAKDQYTRGHSVRVATYAKEMAVRMGKSKEETDMVYYIGLLHDIGKIGISDAIINKPGKLTEEEYAVIKTHPAIGADILKDMTEIPNAAVGAHWHHERYDGNGYPDGLKGEEIPEYARIIGVADAYDAMTSKRSYRDVLPQEVVRGEIEKGKGTQFDPHIADIMLAMMDEDPEYQMRER
jgi:putative two-component system response regulator